MPVSPISADGRRAPPESVRRSALSASSAFFAPTSGELPSLTVGSDRLSANAGAPSSLELRPLQQQIHDNLLGKILRGELGPGEKISPLDIAASLGVSVTPVRDAVNLLAAEGLVHVRPRRGTIVAPMSGDDVAELYEIRLMIEPAAAELVAERATDPEIARIRWLAEQLESSPATGRDTVTDLDLYLAELSVDADFHAELVHAAGNRRLTTLYAGLRPHVLVARINFPTLHRSRPDRRGEHLRVVEAIEARDGARARVAMTEHLHHALGDALRRVAESQDSAEIGKSLTTRT
jgi:DNA-binding GntR family transcriptional regulator